MSLNSVSHVFDSVTPEALDALELLEFSSTNTKRLCLHKDNDSNLQMMLIRMKSNTNFKLHSHSKSDEIAIVVEGRLTYNYESGASITLEKGSQSTIIIGKNEKHSVHSGPEGALFIEIIRGPWNPLHPQKIK